MSRRTYLEILNDTTDKIEVQQNLDSEDIYLIEAVIVRLQEVVGKFNE